VSGMVLAPDGSPVDAFALLPPGPGPELIAAAIGDAAVDVLELGCGAGRLLRPLAERGHRCTGVDQSVDMLGLVPPGIVVHLADIETLDLDRTFDVVVLASFLVNTVDATRRLAFLDAARRHAHGMVVVQRLDPELVPDAVDASSEADGVTYEMHAVEHAGSLFRARMRFVIDGVAYDHAYEGEVLDDATFEACVHGAGLHVERYLDGQRTWAVLR
jgi:SAM-dependent methyltransferase